MGSQKLDTQELAPLFKARSERYTSWREKLRSLEAPSEDGIVKMPYMISQLREILPQDFKLVIEAVTNALHVVHHFNLTKVCCYSHTKYLSTNSFNLARKSLWYRRWWPWMAWRGSFRSEACFARVIHLCNVRSPFVT